ncbi:glycosyltransferase family 4 protein [Fictibacillus iocasae]|uniref:Glycosyltransferase family 4 protein n=1 Tax=Fictibacillus iocasae TaxID=2715437 RepID=A0ABW2NUL4_9BACL
MKILLATYWPLPHMGGIWTFVNELKRGLKRFDIDADIFSASPDHTMYYLHHSTDHIKKTSLYPFLDAQFQRGASLINHPVVARAELEQYCFELSAVYTGLKKYDVIHAQDAIASRALSRVKPKKTPLLTSLHGSLSGEILYHIKSFNPEALEHEIKQNLLYHYHRAIEKEAYKNSDMIHTSSQWLMKKVMYDLNGKSNSLSYIPYGFDYQNFSLSSQTSNAGIPEKPKGKKVLLFTGRLVYLKGIHSLMLALAKVKDIRDDWECWIIGDGDQRSACESQVKKLGLTGKIRFLGQQTNVYPYLKLSDMFIFPSLQDNQPFSIIEAQYSGLPVIVSDSAGLPEMVKHEKNGLIFKAGDYRELSMNIMRLLQDNSLLCKLSKNASKYAHAQWNIQAMSKQLFKLYQKLI